MNEAIQHNKGRLIVLEGIDGAGKTTQAALLEAYLRAKGREVYRTAEPTPFPSGIALREALGGKVKKSECEMAAMFVLDRIAHNNHPTLGIKALLASGADVICDRYYYSNLAYQGQTTDYAWVKSMNLDCPDILRPDVCIYLDLLPEQSLERIRKRGEEMEIYENLERLRAVRSAFLSVIEDLRNAGECIFAVNADRSPDDISEEIFALVNPAIKK